MYTVWECTFIFFFTEAVAPPIEENNASATNADLKNCISIIS